MPRDLGMRLQMDGCKAAIELGSGDWATFKSATEVELNDLRVGSHLSRGQGNLFLFLIHLMWNTEFFTVSLGLNKYLYFCTALNVFPMKVFI